MLRQVHICPQYSDIAKKSIGLREHAGARFLNLQSAPGLS
jgi:hypothetical protein